MHHTHTFPVLTKPLPSKRQEGSTAFVKLMQSATLMQYAPHFEAVIDPDRPLRKSMVAPSDTGSFVKPIKQSFIRNPRLSPMTRVLLTLLSGWTGSGAPISTTTGTLGKHITRSRRTVFTLLQDAVEEGYLTYIRTKCRMGKYTGIKIYLNLAAIRFTGFLKKKKTAQTKDSARGKFPAETNTKHILTTNNDQDLWNRLTKLAHVAGFLDCKPPP